MELFEEYEKPFDTDVASDISGLFELSIDAFYGALYADMSELPIKAEIRRFVEKVKNAGNETGCGKGGADRAAGHIDLSFGAKRRASALGRPVHRGV